MSSSLVQISTDRMDICLPLDCECILEINAIEWQITYNLDTLALNIEGVFRILENILIIPCSVRTKKGKEIYKFDLVTIPEKKAKITITSEDSSRTDILTFPHKAIKQ